MAQTDLVPNRMGLSRATHLHNFISRRSGATMLDDAFLSHPRQDFWMLSTGHSTLNPYHASTNLHQLPTFPLYNHSNAYPYYATTTSDKTIRKRNTIPFSAAARALYTSLTAFLSYAENLEAEFRNDTLYVSAYIDEPTKTHLWACKLDYRGVSAWQQQQQQQTDEGDVEPVPEASFGKHAVRLLEAIDDWRGCEDLSARKLEEVSGRGAG